MCKNIYKIEHLHVILLSWLAKPVDALRLREILISYRCCIESEIVIMTHP